MEQRNKKRRIHKRCNQENCKKSAIGATNKCVEHGGGVRCNYKDCTKSARNKKMGRCKAHGGGKRCNYKDCTKSARASTDKCIKHGGGRRCNQKNCKKSAIGATDKCVKHGGGTPCNFEGCTKSARDKKTGRCKAHGGGERCPNCIDWPDSRSVKSNKYDGYCATCFKHIFPDNPKSKVIYEHTKEIRVRNFINQHFEGFVHDKPLYTGNCDCTHRRRVDHRKLINETVLAIETDEFGHSSYDKHDEEIRYDDLYMIHSGKWIFIRFNPDSNYDKTDIEDKLNILLETMNEQIYRIENGLNTELLEIHALFGP